MKTVLLTVSIVLLTNLGSCSTTGAISTKANEEPISACSNTSTVSIKSTKLESKPAKMGSKSKLEPRSPETSDFAEIRRSDSFIDKTDFIHEWLIHQPRNWYVPAPPGFGKSSLLSMVRYFCGGPLSAVEGTPGTLKIDSEKNPDNLFRGTLVSELKDFFHRHFQKYIVVSIDLSPLRKATDYRSFRHLLCGVLSNLVNNYLPLLEPNNLEEIKHEFFEMHNLTDTEHTAAFCHMNYYPLKEHVPLLVKKLKEHTGKDVIVLVDDVDASLKAILMNNITTSDNELFSDLQLFVRSFTERSPWGPAKCLFTGSFDLRLAIPGNTSIQISDFFRDKRIAVYFGLTQREVEKLLLNYSLQDHNDEVRRMLNGINIMGSSNTLFNTRAVLSYIKKRKISEIDDLTSTILRGFKNLFADEWIGQDITQILFGDGIVIKEDRDPEYTDLLGLKTKVTHGSALETHFHLNKPQHDIFIRILLRLGLMKIVKYNRHGRLTLGPTNTFTAGILRDYFYKSSYIERYYKVKARDGVLLTSAITNLTPSNFSIQAFGEAISNIVKECVPDDEAHFKSLIYMFAQKAADHYSKDILLETDVPIQIYDNGTLRGGPLSEKTIDLLMVEKRKSMGIIIVMKFKINAVQVLRLIKSRRCIEVFDGKRYSKYNLMDKMVIGISVSHSGSIDIKGEVLLETGIIKLSYYWPEPETSQPQPQGTQSPSKVTQPLPKKTPVSSALPPNGQREKKTDRIKEKNREKQIKDYMRNMRV
ncbi:unnamed protein product [Bemisia tabaci]|uniref:AAA-ATPase-like domain-containing protein n=2 Tax=Bemisia tabaci TaxID=7038 RepID=A0A9P0G4X3_BEMTA|nr:unnamed protein product [Bemisia tabaci]